MPHHSEGAGHAASFPPSDRRISRPDLGRTPDFIEVYQRLGVGEVWFWIRGAVMVHVLTDHGYEPRTESTCIPGFDFARVSEMMGLPSLSVVRKAIRERLEAKR